MYSKIIISGSQIETFKYEKLPYLLSNNVVKNSNLGKDRIRHTEEQAVQRREDNANRARINFGRLCASNFTSSEIAVFGTLTFKEEQTVRSGYSLFNIFTTRLRKRYGKNVRYIAVPEFGTTKTKRLHFHILLWGLPLEEIKQERATRNFAKVWKYGYIDLVITNNDIKIGFYLAKYLTKTFLDYRLKGMKAYIGSRNLIKPVEDKNAMLGPYYHGEGYQLSTARVVHEKEYMTQWLGKGRIRIYKQIKNIPHAN